MRSPESVILFAHGARDARWSAALHALASELRTHGGLASVRIAYLELQSPTLPEALEAAAAEGARRVHVVPVFWAGAGHIDNDLPPLLTAFGQRHPGVTVAVLPVLSELPGMLEFIARAVAASLSDDPESHPSSASGNGER